MHRLLIAGLVVLVAVSCVGQDSPPPAPSNEQLQKPGKLSTALQDIRNLPAEWIIGPYIPVSGPLHPLTKEQRFGVYYQQTFLTTNAYVLRMLAAGIDQARNSPSQWGGGMEAYGERFASRYGVFILSSTFHSFGNGLLGYESRYDLCRCSGFWLRARHAVVRNFVTYDRTERNLKPAIPLYAGSFGAGMIASTWLPGPRDEFKQGAYSALGQAGFGTAYNFASEFAIDILRKVTGNKYPKNPNSH